jgi:hypothetical protein
MSDQEMRDRRNELLDNAKLELKKAMSVEIERLGILSPNDDKVFGEGWFQGSVESAISVIDMLRKSP